MKIPALGKKFQLGCLYDSRRNKIVTGEMIGSEEVISKSQKPSKPDGHYTQFVLSGNNFEEYLKTTGFDTSFKLGFLCDKFRVGASVGREIQSSSCTSRVILQCCQHCRYEELNLSELQRKECYEVELMNWNATHVVVGILYGVEGYMLFESEAQNESEAKKTQAHIEAMIGVGTQGWSKTHT